MGGNTSSEERWVEIVVAPEWSRVEAVRRVTDALVRAVARSGGTELADELGIVAGELMENAVKYGKPGEPVWFQLRREGFAVVISVTNVADMERASPMALASRVEWLTSFETALAAYHATIEALADERTGQGAGLGLARVLYEGQCGLRCAVGDDGRVTIEARRDWPVEAAA